MEGLIGVTIENRPMGPVECRLEFRDPPAALVEAIEYAMVNRLLFYFQNAPAGRLGLMSMVIVNVDIRNEVVPNAYGPLKTIRHVTVAGYVGP